MLIGNFNTTLDYKRDRLEYSNTPDSHKNCRNLINAWFSNEKWVDSFDWHHKKMLYLGVKTKQRAKRSNRSLPCNLIKFTKLVNHISIGEHLTDYVICIDWAKATRGKAIFRAKLGIEKNTQYQKLIKGTIKKV